MANESVRSAEASARSCQEHDDAGLFPRRKRAALQRVARRSTGMKAVGEKKVVRLVPSKQKRKQWAKAREESLQTAERERREDLATEEAVEALRVRRLQHAMHKSGKQRAREVQRGGELEVESDEEVEVSAQPEKASLDEVMSEEKQQTANADTQHATTVCGDRISAEAGLVRVLGALGAPGDCSPVSARDLRAQTAIDLLDPVNSMFKALVVRSSAVHVLRDSASLLLLKKQAPFRLESQICLMDLFKNRIPSGGLLSGNSKPAYAISEEEIDGAYEGVTAHIDWAIRERVVAAYTADGREKWRVLIPRMPWAARSKELSALWRACPLPESEKQLRESALAAGVRPLIHINSVDQRNKAHKQRADREAALQEPLRRKKPKAAKGKVPLLVAAAANGGDCGYLSDVFD